MVLFRWFRAWQVCPGPENRGRSASGSTQMQPSRAWIYPGIRAILASCNLTAQFGSPKTDETGLRMRALLLGQQLSWPVRSRNNPVLKSGYILFQPSVVCGAHFAFPRARKRSRAPQWGGRMHANKVGTICPKYLYMMQIRPPFLPNEAEQKPSSSRRRSTCCKIRSILEVDFPRDSNIVLQLYPQAPLVIHEYHSGALVLVHQRVPVKIQK